MNQSFTIHGKLPSLNDYISAMNSHRHVGNSLKRKTQDVIGWHARGANLKRMDGPVDIECVWFEQTRRRDPDNVTAATKFILDALVECRIIPDDSQRTIRFITHRVMHDKDAPRIEVTLEEAK